MRVVHKYSLDWTGTGTSLLMPAGAEVLCVQMQDSVPQLWALVDPMQPNERREFKIIGTGWEIHEALRYVGTYQWGMSVWHVFESVQ